MKQLLVLVFLGGVSICSAGVPSLDEYRAALDAPTFAACQRALDPLLQSASENSRMGDRAANAEIAALLAKSILSFRIGMDDADYSRQLQRMEYYLRLVAEDGDLATERRHLLNLADYLANETVRPLAGKEEYLKARRLDEELVRTGKIERPVVFLNRASTPNLQELDMKNYKVKRWNGEVERHRRRVLGLYKKPMAAYLSTLDKEDAGRFMDEFSAKAKLSAEERARVFKPQTEQRQANSVQGVRDCLAV